MFKSGIFGQYWNDCSLKKTFYFNYFQYHQFSSVQLLSHVWLFATPWTAALQASLSFTISWSLLRFMSIESMMPSNHLILCHPHLLLSSIVPNIKVFSSELAIIIRWSKYWSFSFSLSPPSEYSRSFPWIPFLGTGQILLPLKFTAAGNRQISYVQSQPQPWDSSQRPAGFASSIKFCGGSRSIQLPLPWG